MVAPPWLPGTRVVERRVILASRLQKAATELAENSSQFAVWSLNRVKSYNKALSDLIAL
jgi:hypothetical protein